MLLLYSHVLLGNSQFVISKEIQLLNRCSRTLKYFTKLIAYNLTGVLPIMSMSGRRFRPRCNFATGVCKELKSVVEDCN